MAHVAPATGGGLLVTSRLSKQGHAAGVEAAHALFLTDSVEGETVHRLFTRMECRSCAVRPLDGTLWILLPNCRDTSDLTYGPW